MIGKEKTTLSVAAMLLAAGLTLCAQDTGKQPSERVRFKKGEHPRIWVTAADLPAVRARCAVGGSHEREFKRLKGLVDLEMEKSEVESGEDRRFLEEPVPPAFLYLMTGERKYAECARNMLKAWAERGDQPDRHAGVALDWILAKSSLDRAEGVPVTPAELTELVQGITSTGGRWQLKVEDFQGRTDYPYVNNIFHHPIEKPWQYKQPAMFYLTLALHGEGEEFAKYDEALDWIVRWAKEEWIAASNRWERGTRFPGFSQYYGYHNGSEARVAQAWKVATGEDLFAESVQLREFARHVFYMREPFTDHAVNFSDGQHLVDVDSIMPIYSHANPDATVRALAQYIENRRLTDENLWNKPVEDTGTRRTTLDLWQRILWYDPGAPEAALDSTPTAATFAGNGYTAMRSGWNREATALFLVAGDHMNHHQISNQGHFEIFRKGALTAWAGGHRRTIGGNCLLVHDPEEIFFEGWNRFHKHPNDGGQYLFEHAELYTGGDWRKRSKDDIHDVAETVGFESTPLYDYVAADLTNAYRRETKDTLLAGKEAESLDFTPANRKNKLSRCTRQIVFLKPDIFVMCDRVDSTDAEFAKTWLLHTQEEPALEGALYTAEAGEGKLMVKRLSPQEATVRKVGGPELMAWARKGEWPTEVRESYRDNLGGLWRIEESPVEKRTDDVFLHVLYACDKGTPTKAMPKCEAISTPDVTGLEVEYLGRTYEVTFRREGRHCAGRIKIIEGGKALVDRALAEKVWPAFEVLPPMPDWE